MLEGLMFVRKKFTTLALKAGVFCFKESIDQHYKWQDVHKLYRNMRRNISLQVLAIAAVVVKPSMTG